MTKDGRVLTLVASTPGSVTSQPAPSHASPGSDFLEGRAPRPSAKKIRRLFQYDRESGILRWRVSRGSARAGDVAGTIRPDGYRQIQINGILYLEHVLIWVGVHGVWPSHEIDHANTVRHDNSWGNLREATRAQQLANQGLRKNSRTGTKGVTRLPSGLYSARLGKVVIGTFATLDEAATAWWKAAQEAHGEFAREDRRLTSADYFDQTEKYRGRQTLEALRERASAWRIEVQEQRTFDAWYATIDHDRSNEVYRMFQMEEWCDRELKWIGEVL